MKTSRRNVLKLAAAGSFTTALSGQDEHKEIQGPLAQATVSFGQWRTDTPLDRLDGVPPTANNHQLVPNQVTIKAGGAVNFVIAGFHNVMVYDDGTQPQDIDTTKLRDSLLIDDPNNRIYRGLDPRSQSQDRVEVVQFSKPGTFLMACGVLAHFRAGMFGFVKVLPAEEDSQTQ